MNKVEIVDTTVFVAKGGMKTSSLFGSLCGRRVAFTMAEILLSLTIIGVVAAITLPSLTGNINERTWNTQRKALFARMSQSMSLLDSVRGFGNVVMTSPPNEYGWGAVYNCDNAAEAFLSAGLSKVYKINNICDSNHISDCGMPNEVINLVGSKIQLSSMTDLFTFHDTFSFAGCGSLYTINAKSAAMETQNGESLLVFYNPVCKDLLTSLSIGGSALSPHNIMCVNMIYDLNGKKGPNTVNKDVGFITMFYPTDPIIVAPVPAAKNASTSSKWKNASSVCSAQGEDYRVPNKEEITSIGLNYKLVDDKDFHSYTYATSSKWSGMEGEAWTYIGMGGAEYHSVGPGYTGPEGDVAVRCIKRF